MPCLYAHNPRIGRQSGTVYRRRASTLRAEARLISYYISRKALAFQAVGDRLQKYVSSIEEDLEALSGTRHHRTLSNSRAVSTLCLALLLRVWPGARGIEFLCLRGMFVAPTYDPPSLFS